MIIVIVLLVVAVALIFYAYQKYKTLPADEAMPKRIFAALSLALVTIGSAAMAAYHVLTAP